jgi:DNA-binding IclR family transcriptional regulator
VARSGGGRTLSTAVHALQALQFIGRTPRGASVKGVARALGLSLSSAYSLINSLRSQSFVVDSPAAPGLYVLGPKLVDLYRSYVLSKLQPEGLEPFLVDLRERAAARTYAALWKNKDLEVAETLGRRGSRELQDVSKGFRGAAHALALGKIFLAEFPESEWPRYLHVPVFRRFARNTLTTPGQLRHNLAAVRARGLGLDIEEYSEGVCCVAAPVRDQGGRPLAALAVSVPARRFKHQYRSLASAVRDTADTASRELQEAIGSWDALHREDVSSKN